jgi:hypothetical protein
MGIAVVDMPVLPIVRNHLIINCVLVLLTLAVVGLRLTSRHLSGVKLWWDDFLILAAVPLGIGMLVVEGLCKSIYYHAKPPLDDFTDVEINGQQTHPWALGTTSSRACRTSRSSSSSQSRTPSSSASP